MSSPLATLVAQRVAKWNASHGAAEQIDPAAELAVSTMEGLSGGRGDGNTSFGPNQLHAHGALPAEVWARGADYAHEWAWSPPGIDYALSRIAGVAGGQHGAQAIDSIVRRFERPAKPDQEVAGAQSVYGRFAGGGAPAAPAGPPSVPPRARLASLAGGGTSGPSPLIAQLLAQNNEILGVPSPALSLPFFGASTKPTPPARPAPPRPSLATTMAGRKLRVSGANVGSLDPAFQAELDQALLAGGAVGVDYTSGERSPLHNAAVGGATHSNHLPDAAGRAHAVDGYAILGDGARVPLGQFLAKTASRYKLRSGASFNWNGRPDVVHVDDGFNGGR